MLSRTSHVKQITVKTVIFSSNFQIGDTQYIDSASNVLAIQQQKRDFSGDDFHYEDFRVFNYRTPLPVIFENFPITTFNNNPHIYVDKIDVIGVTTSSTLAVGNVMHVRLSNRVLNIRQFNDQQNLSKGG